MRSVRTTFSAALVGVLTSWVFAGGAAHAQMSGATGIPATTPSNPAVTGEPDATAAPSTRIANPGGLSLGNGSASGSGTAAGGISDPGGLSSNGYGSSAVSTGTTGGRTGTGISDPRQLNLGLGAGGGGAPAGGGISGGGIATPSQSDEYLQPIYGGQGLR